MSAASELPPEVFIPAAARPAALRAVPGLAAVRASRLPSSTVRSLAIQSPFPVAPAAAAIGAGVTDLDRWRHHVVGAQAGDRQRNAAGLRTRPAASTISAPVRLTRRGIVLLGALCVLCALAIVVVARLSVANTAGVSGAAGGSNGSAVVTVHAGDSLWGIAREVAPNRDPRAVVDELRKLNRLSGDTVTPGQQLRVR